MQNPRKKMDEWNWLKSKLGNIANPDFTRKFLDVSNVYYTAHTWTPLKLIVLAFWITIYTRIISKNYPGKFYYIDLLAGPGINKIEETGNLILGSPLLATLVPEDQFSKLFFFEINDISRKALRSRLDIVLKPDQYEIYGDCNTNIDKILPHLEGGHYFAFVDYEKFGDVSWNTLQKLLVNPGDVVITLQTAELNRIFGLPSAHDLTKKLYGMENVPEIAKTEEERLKLYMERLQSTKRNRVLNITVKGGKGVFHYDVILAARETRGGSPWWRAAEELKKLVEEHTGDAVEKALHVLAGKQREIDWFCQQKSGLEKYFS